MAWTYSRNPADSPKDRVRFELGDVLESDPLITDEEIEFCISVEDSIEGAVARAAEHIWQRFLTEVNTSAGGLNLDLQTRAKNWGDRARELRAKAASSPQAVPSAGGVDQAEAEGMYFALGHMNSH